MQAKNFTALVLLVAVALVQLSPLSTKSIAEVDDGSVTEPGSAPVVDVRTDGETKTTTEVTEMDETTTAKTKTRTTTPEVEKTTTTVEAEETTEKPVVKTTTRKAETTTTPKTTTEEPVETTTSPVETTTTARPVPKTEAAEVSAKKVTKKEKEESESESEESVVETTTVKPKSKKVNHEVAHKSNRTKQVKIVEICSGALQSPWFCMLDDFVEDKRCSYVYSLKWTYERQRNLLEIKFRYQPSANERVAIGFVEKQSANGWFAVNKSIPLFGDFLYWNEQSESTEIVRLAKNFFKIKQLIAPEKIKCSGLGFFIYNVNETDNETINYLFHAASRSEVCASSCSICLSRPDMGIPCSVDTTSRWYFNKKYGRCVQFMYSGCGGNQNNFLTKEACLGRCAPNLLEELKESNTEDAQDEAKVSVATKKKSLKASKRRDVEASEMPVKVEETKRVEEEEIKTTTTEASTTTTTTEEVTTTVETTTAGKVVDPIDKMIERLKITTVEPTTTTTTTEETTTTTTTTTAGKVVDPIDKMIEKLKITTVEPTTTTEETTTTTTTTEAPTTTAEVREETTTTTRVPETTTTTGKVVDPIDKMIEQLKITTVEPTTTTTTTTEETTTTTTEPTTTTTTTEPTTTTTTTTTTEPTTTTVEETTTTTTTTTTPTTTTEETTTTTTTTTVEPETTTTTTEPTTTTTPEPETTVVIIETTTTPKVEETTTTTTVETTTTTEPTTTTTTTESTTTTTTTEETTTTTTTEKVPETTTTVFVDTTTTKSFLNSSLEDLSNQIKFEVTNYTVVNNSSDNAETKSYSLRLHIKGYKWNERFQDVNSTEARDFMRSKILPLLYKYLNVTPDELNEVKLLRLFKGSVQSDLVVKPNAGSSIDSALRVKANTNLTIHEHQIMTQRASEVRNFAKNVSSAKANLIGHIDKDTNETCNDNFTTNYTMVIMGDKTIFDRKSFNRTIENMVKNAMLKYFSPGLDELHVTVVQSRCLNDSLDVHKLTGSSVPVEIMNITLRFGTSYKIELIDIKLAMETAAVSKLDCKIEKLSKKASPYCSYLSPSSNTLIRFADFWIDLGHNELPTSERLVDEIRIFTYKPAWIIGLAVIGAILVIFFIGCLIAICYTRRPYRRAGKIYELDTNSRPNQIPQIPTMYPSTKASQLPKPKELHY